MSKFLKSSYLKFVLGGIIFFGLEYGLTIALTEINRLKPFLSYAIALTISLLILFQYHTRFTFKTKKPICKKTFAKFILTYGIFYFLNWFFSFLLMMKISYKIAIPTVTILLSTALYFAYEKIVFVKGD